MCQWWFGCGEGVNTGWRRSSRRGTEVRHNEVQSSRRLPFLSDDADGVMDLTPWYPCLEQLLDLAGELPLALLDRTIPVIGAFPDIQGQKVRNGRRRSCTPLKSLLFFGHNPPAFKILLLLLLTALAKALTSLQRL